ncbi:MAG: hypothetical protein WCK27_31400 [Verrucomicrobiota bacterium]
MEPLVEWLRATLPISGLTPNPLLNFGLPVLRSRTAEGDASVFSRTTIVETPNLDTSVACGAALACYWKHERGSAWRPARMMQNWPSAIS